MANSVVLQAEDTILINGSAIADFSDGDVATLDFPNEICTIKTGYDGNTILAFNHSGKQATLQIKVLRGSADDQRLNGLIRNNMSVFANTAPLCATVKKKVANAGIVNGVPTITGIVADTYTLINGAVKKVPAAKTNTEGDSEQAVAVYDLAFGSGERSFA